jgi:DnaJ-domain-containing protein 1
MTTVTYGGSMTTDGKYLYGFIRANERQSYGPIGIEGADVYTFPFQDIAAVISDLPHVAFGSLPKEILLRYLTVYQSVLETVLKVEQVIPVKFGTALEGDAALQIALEQGHVRILDGLREMENKIELDVVALWPDLNAVLTEIGGEEEFKAVKEGLPSMSDDERFDLRVAVGKRVKVLLHKRSELCKEEIMNSMLPHIEAHRVHSLMDDSMIMNVAILIRKDQVNPVEERIVQLDRQYEDRINFRIIGPLPPYSFQTLEIKNVDYDLLNEARKTLELQEDTTVQEIRDAYWKLTKKFHPDKFPGHKTIQEHFEKINEAYRLLGEYCKDKACSFRESDVRNWMVIQPVEDRSPMSEVTWN